MQTGNYKKLVDAFDRKVTYLRLSVTDRCNLNCRYCAPSMPMPLPKNRLLSLDEMHRLVRIGAGLGIEKVRLTGGEPLCRRGLPDFIVALNRIPGLNDVSLTTNATMLQDQLLALLDAGLQRINISLDTMDRQKYHRLAGADRYRDVWRGIMAAAEAGLNLPFPETPVMMMPSISSSDEGGVKESSSSSPSS